MAQEIRFLKDWRQDGPIGVLLGILNYIHTPQQYQLFQQAQHTAYTNDPTKPTRRLELVKPVITRWNSYYDAFVRALQLKDAIDEYAAGHIFRARDKKPTDVPYWMKSNGLTAHDWAVITEYTEALKPLKEATLHLEGRGRSGSFGAIYEILPIFEAILKAYEDTTLQFRNVDFEQAEAPEDHLKINLTAAWHKLDLYYTKLEDSPYYYAAVCLHPRYKRYCKTVWQDKPHWIKTGELQLQQLWALYKPSTTVQQQPPIQPRQTSIQDSIAALLDTEQPYTIDQLERWRTHEPAWTISQYISGSNPIQYWLDLKPQYPQLSQMAIDILSIPASSCDCERMFSELGDLLEPRRRHMGSGLLAALQCVRSWQKAGLNTSRIAEMGPIDDEVDTTARWNDE